jgi:hypothetical protein
VFADINLEKITALIALGESENILVSSDENKRGGPGLVYRLKESK